MLCNVVKRLKVGLHSSVKASLPCSLHPRRSSAWPVSLTQKPALYKNRDITKDAIELVSLRYLYTMRDQHMQQLVVVVCDGVRYCRQNSVQAQSEMILQIYKFGSRPVHARPQLAAWFLRMHGELCSMSVTIKQVFTHGGQSCCLADMSNPFATAIHLQNL